MVWATTWEYTFQEHAHLAGINTELPAVPFSTLSPPETTISTDVWKFWSLTRLYDGNPLVWIDDGNFNFLAPELHNGPYFPLFPNPRIGMTQEQGSQVINFVEEHASK